MAEPAGQASKLDAAKAALKRGLIAFLVVDGIFIAGAVALYFGMVRPRVTDLTAARDRAVRSNVAMTIRVRAIEGRLALAQGDAAAAAVAAGEVEAQLADLRKRIPKSDAGEVTEVTTLGARAALIRDEISRDPATAQRDLELIEARLGATYPSAPLP